MDQSAGMLDDTAIEAGFALTCIAEPTTDCTIEVMETEGDLNDLVDAMMEAGHGKRS